MLKYVRNLAIAIVALFAPAQGMLMAAAALIAIDLATGLLAAKKRGDKITSAGLKRTVVKITIYEIAIALAFITETYLSLGFMPLARIVSSFIGVTELKSIYENLNELGGGDLLKTIISRLSGPNE